ncbi:MAG TPA: putative sulfate exporter family transporter, partial [Myxococcota bacterium]|nr:putative sulfate exporter family transporter [Myxococcota bacterium]
MESSRRRLTSGHVLVPALAALSLSPVVTSVVALVMGALVALAVGNPYLEYTRKLTPRLLSYCIVGLGAGMNLEVVARVGMQGLGYTAVSILSTLAAGLLLGRMLGVERI